MNLLSLLGGSLAKGVGSIVGRVLDSKDKKIGSEHSESIERLRQAGSYMGDNRTWWDSLVDGVNRLVRPCFTFGTLFLFYLSVSNPIAFHSSMQAMSAIPDPLWIILGTIIVFWFGQKKLDGLRKPRPPSAKEVEGILHNVKKIKELENDTLSNNSKLK